MSNVNDPVVIARQIARQLCVIITLIKIVNFTYLRICERTYRQSQAVDIEKMTTTNPT